MACFFLNRANSSVSIPRTEEIDSVVYYVLEMQVGNVSWVLTHRYSDFYELHTKLSSDHGVLKDTIPPKKLIRKKCPYFISQRREGLEIYMKTVLNYLQRALPLELAVFLDFHVYETHYMLEDLALQYFVKGDGFLSTAQVVTMNPIQLFAITQRLQQPCPDNELDKRKDFSHVLDVCSQNSKLHIVGSHQRYRQSNIVPNQLCFELTPFKALGVLKVTEFPMKNITALGNLRDTVVILIIERTNTQHISEILLCDSIHKVPSAISQNWRKMTEMNLTDNQLKDIDASVKLLPNLNTLNLNQNQIHDLTNLAFLPNLSHLYLSGNMFHITDNLHMKLGNILHLDLSANYIQTLAGFSKLYSLEFLDLSSNKIASLDEVKYIGGLPCLENLRLTGNPVSIVVDYRVKVLEQFGTRANELCLDSEMPTQDELDTICVLQAIRIVKEGKTPTFDGTDLPSLFMVNTNNISS